MADAQATSAEIAHVQLRSCLVNLPPVLAEAVVNAGTPAQNLIVELQVQVSDSRRIDPSALPHSIYVGWTGISSRKRPGASHPIEAASSKNTKAANYIEIDAAFARVLDLSDGQKVAIVLRQNPELVHTVNVEPLTSGDWEMIELHAAFLETNLQAQVRALPNPDYTGSKTRKAFAHPLTLHLSPTSTANVIVSSFTPSVSPSIAYAKLAPDAEVIVAPKSRTRSPKTSRVENRSVTGLSQRSIGTRSGTGSTKSRARKSDVDQQSLFLRAVNTSLCPQSEDQANAVGDSRFPTIWVDEAVVKGKFPKAGDWMLVSALSSTPANVGTSAEDLQKLQAQENTEAGKHASRIVARLQKSRWLPSCDHVAINPALSTTLGLRKQVGEILRIESAPSIVPPNLVKGLKIYPFKTGTAAVKQGLKIGGENYRDRVMLAQDLKHLLGSKEGSGFLCGALTDGMIIAAPESPSSSWRGGMLRFTSKALAADGKPITPRWTIDPNEELPIEVGDEIHSPLRITATSQPGQEDLPIPANPLIGLEKVLEQVVNSLVHQSSVLLEGSMGAGKTSLSTLVAQELESQHFFHVSYLDCRKLTTDETRVSTIKEVLKALFMEAWWGSQLGGKSVIIFDDLDKLCPAETELQVGGENARSRQLSEIFSSIVHQNCSGATGVTILATATSKESLQSVLVGSHIVRDIISIKAPEKTQRRDIIQALVSPGNAPNIQVLDKTSRELNLSNDAGRQNSVSGDEEEEAAAFHVDQDVDFLDIAGKIDGYMPGDLVLLTSRTRSEAIMRSIRHNDASQVITISSEDFTGALKGFTPVSLRNVTLQSSSTTFNSIGGLESTRKILLETLQYPTTYAPIFARCPLRLRSGLLLYGYPGCGKTLLASAVAGECGLNFISVKGPEILNKYIGASEKSVRDLFDRAESAKPCVLFFDEFDSIAPKRGHDSTGVTDRVVNQLLTQMDGAEGLSGVYVLAATSRPDLIDPALLRPGRLDKSLLCDMPNEKDRLGILEALSKNLKMNPSIRAAIETSPKNLAEVARRTAGYSGADLQAVISNAHLEAVHEVLLHQQPGVQAVKPVASKHRPLQQKELLAFQFGEHGKEMNGGEAAPSKLAPRPGERMALLAQLEALKLARRKEKAIRRGQHDAEGSRSMPKDEGPEPVIQWKHLETSLTTTRKSINDTERNKLERIYKEFLVGRDGEMPTGQASNEVGARSSLM